MTRPLLRRVFAALAVVLATTSISACRQNSDGLVRVVVIGGAPQLRDPARAQLAPGDALLLQNVAQGLVAFDPAGNIVGGLAERWTVTDDGLSYIFRLANTQWSGGKKVTAQQVARILQREMESRSRNPLSDSLGAVQEVVPMTDRVLEIRLKAARPNLLALLAQPETALLREGRGTGPFTILADNKEAVHLSRDVPGADGDSMRRDQLLLAGETARDAVRAFAAGDADLVLGGTFADLPFAAGAKLPRGSLRFDPASGLFGLLPRRSSGPLGSADARRLLSQAIDRDSLIAALAVPNLAARATVLEPGLDGTSPPLPPAWTATPLADRLPALQAQARKLFPAKLGAVRVQLPDGPGGDILLRRLQHDWGVLGLSVVRASSPAAADFQLIDRVAPSASPAWFVRRFRCEVTPVCDEAADEFMDSARATAVPAERYSMLGQAAEIIDGDQLFIPLTAPIRWSLVSARIKSFAGNRFAVHSLSDLDQKLGS